MQTNFFNHITGLEFQGNLNLTIAKSGEGKLTVSVLLTSTDADKAGKLIPPMILQGNAGELDEGFFTAISTPLEKTAQLFANMDAYQKSLDAAKQQSKAELDKKNKVKDKAKPANTDEDNDDEEEPETENLFSTKEAEEKEATQKKKRYDDAMAQIAELNRSCKYSEAIALLPSATDYPEKADEINRKSQELAKRKTQYDELMQDL